MKCVEAVSSKSLHGKGRIGMMLMENTFHGTERVKSNHNAFWSCSIHIRDIRLLQVPA